MAIRPITLRDFLSQANIAGESNLPWVHSSSASNLLDMVASGKLIATPCNVFRGENLCYLFIGRPAYKLKPIEEPSYWQLPIAFVVRLETPPPIKRVFPFDSGAFVKRRLPSYITTFKLDGYNLAGDDALVGRLISFFFKSQKRYFDRIPTGQKELEDEHSLDPRHAEILALARLYHDRSAPEFDDRAAAIEIQIEADIELKRENLLGIVMPEEYARITNFVRGLKSIANFVETYRHFPLGTSAHYGLLYEGVQQIYKKSGIAL